VVFCLADCIRTKVKYACREDRIGSTLAETVDQVIKIAYAT
jgi:hypothetical protein